MKKLPNYNLGATYNEEELEGVQDVIKSGIISGFIANAGPKFYGGEQVKLLEDDFKKYFGSKYAVGTNSATSSLHCALKALKIKDGDEVIVPSISMSASGAVVKMCNAKPVFVDIADGLCKTCSCTFSENKRRGCFNINTAQIKSKITSRTKAIIVVHLFGQPADMRAILKIAKEFNLKVIEDCAQAPGVKYDGQFVGTFGDIGVFSFNQSKTISSGEGSVAITNNEIYSLRMQLMRNHAEAMIESFNAADYEDLVGYNYRLTDLEAVVAKIQFSRLDKYNQKKLVLANYLSEKLQQFDGLQGLGKFAEFENAFFIYPILFDKSRFSISRNEFVSICNKHGIPFVAGYVTPMTRLPLFKDDANYEEYPITNHLHDNALIQTKICHHQNISLEDIDDICHNLELIFKEIS